jgi:pimeloyl-ACP methyl ester carboxylesterase
VITIGLPDGTSDASTLIVRPKPVILVHGLASDASTWHAYVGAGGFLAGVNLLWRGYAVGDGQAPGLMDTSPFNGRAYTIAQNAGQQATYIQGVRYSTDAEHVDVVGHSMGGLISRYYIQELMPDPPPGDSRPVVSHLVMLGTPNEGSPCAYLAIAAQASPLGAFKGIVSPVAQPLYQLAPQYLAQFNTEINNARGVPFSILAGDAFTNFALCTDAFGGVPSGSGTPGTTHGTGLAVPNDGVVSVPSAEWEIQDRTVEDLNHIQMTGSQMAFATWVEPHLALGPKAAGGGTYGGPLVPSRRAHLRVADGARAAAQTAVARPADTNAKKATPRACTATESSAPLIAQTEASVASGHPVSLPVSVPDRAGEIGVSILTGPDVTSSLLAPDGRVVDSVQAGSAAAGGLFRSLTAIKPRSGGWRVEVSVPSGDAASDALIGVLIARQPLATSVAVKIVKRRLAHHRSMSVLDFSVRVRVHGRPARSAREILALLGSAAKTTQLTLRAVKRRPGLYTGTLARPAAGSVASVVLHSSAGAANQSTLLALSNCDA